MFASARNWLAKAIAPAVQVPAQKQVRQYAGAQFNRLTTDWVAQSTSADSELLTSIRTLRNRGRQLVRDNEYARNAQRIIRNNVIGHQGISFQSQVMMRRGGKLDDATNTAIETEFKRWCKKQTCSTSGRYSFIDIQRLAINALPESGEFLIRMVKQPFGGGRIPFALEVFEADQLVDNYTVGRTENGNQIRMGVELDQWLRPVAYWMYPHHPGDMMFAGQSQPNRYIRVPADEIIHLGIAERPNQTRFASWFASVLMRLNNMAGYEEAEIVAARASACIMGFIQTPDISDASLSTPDPANGQRVTDLAAGTLQELGPGEQFNGFAPSRPNAAMEPFMRFMLRAFGVGLGVNYAPMSGDYSQANYSSERAAQLNSRDEWRALQVYFMEHMHQRIYEAWLEMAVLSGVLNLPGYFSNPEQYAAVTWQPRGWEWVDPLKDVMASKLSVRAGFDTISGVVSAKGGDVEEIFKTRRREIDLAADFNLVLETDPAQVDDKGAAQKTDVAAAEAAAGDEPLETAAKMLAESIGQLEARIVAHLEAGNDLQAAALMERLENIESLAAKQPNVNVTIAEGAVRVEPSFDVAAPNVHIDSHVAAPVVNIEHARRATETITRDANREIIGRTTNYEVKP